MHAIQVCNPQSQSFLYLLCSPLLGFIIWTRKLLILKQSWQSEHLVGQKEDLQHICDVFLSLIPLKDAFLKLIRIAMTIGVNTAHCEGSFSTLKRIKSYLRSTMCEQR